MSNMRLNGSTKDMSTRGASSDGMNAADMHSAGVLLGHTPLRILWVKMGGLWPANSGGRLRSYHMINELSRDNDVTVLTTHSSDESTSALRAHLPYCKRIDSRPFSPPKSTSKAFLLSLAASWLSRLPVDVYKYQLPELRREVQFLLAGGNFDVCIADFMTAIPNVAMTGATPVVFFSHNVEYMIWQRLRDNEPSWLKRVLLSIEWRKMRRAEKRACRAAVATIAVSAEDARKLRENCEHAHVDSVNTGVDIDYFTANSTVAKDPFAIVFSGSMDWHPNEDAMLYFMKDVFQKVRAQVPEATLSIVGRHPSQRLRTAAMLAGAEVTGTVTDIRPWLDKAAVYIVPLRIGGGTRLKIYEALSMGKAVVSTTIGAEGLSLLDDVHLLRADTTETFVNSIVMLLKNPEMRTSLGDAGRQLMEENYGWSKIAVQFESLCRAAIADKSGNAPHS
ncbi:MAG: glycosyltransferase family 4 protein [Gammaproteobacteria bacterium]|nr:glycosyltransferase family 4 protein [Gammaproteobacteria bacterium]